MVLVVRQAVALKFGPIMAEHITASLDELNGPGQLVWTFTALLIGQTGSARDVPKLQSSQNFVDACSIFMRPYGKAKARPTGSLLHYHSELSALICDKEWSAGSNPP